MVVRPMSGTYNIYDGFFTVFVRRADDGCEANVRNIHY